MAILCGSSFEVLNNLVANKIPAIANETGKTEKLIGTIECIVFQSAVIQLEIGAKPATTAKIANKIKGIFIVQVPSP